MKIFKVEFFILGCLFMAAFVVKSCNGSTNSELNIRVENASIYDYKNVQVQGGTTDHNYGDLNAGETSEYKLYDYAYSYAFVSLQIDGENYTIQPIDFIGEERLDPGNYSYIISASDSESEFDRLTIELRVD